MSDLNTPYEAGPERSLLKISKTVGISALGCSLDTGQ